jgi:hypothetical protein
MNRFERVPLGALLASPMGFGGSLSSVEMIVSCKLRASAWLARAASSVSASAAAILCIYHLLGDDMRGRYF